MFLDAANARSIDYPAPSGAGQVGTTRELMLSAGLWLLRTSSSALVAVDGGGVEVGRGAIPVGPGSQLEMPVKVRDVARVCASGAAGGVLSAIPVVSALAEGHE